MTGTDRSPDSLSDLLPVVATQGWGSTAGREAVEVMRRACRREAARWTRTAGWLTDEGLAVVWEQMDRLVKAAPVRECAGSFAGGGAAGVCR